MSSKSPSEVPKLKELSHKLTHWFDRGLNGFKRIIVYALHTCKHRPTLVLIGWSDIASVSESKDNASFRPCVVGFPPGNRSCKSSTHCKRQGDWA